MHLGGFTSVPDPTAIELRLLGGLSVRTTGREASGVRAQPKRFALLAYLAAAVPRGFHRRDSLLALFWPEADQDHARTSLRKALHLLRHELGPDLILSRGDEEVGLAPERCWCDAVAFEEAVQAGRCEVAIDLYQSDLLAGFHLSDAPEFERWMDETRARLRDSATRAAWTLAEGGGAEAHPAAAVRWARRATALSPYDESGVRRLVTLLDRAGDRAGAVLAYEEFAQRLSADLELEPAAETVALVEAIRSRNGARSGPVLTSPTTATMPAPWATSPLSSPARRATRTAIVLGLGFVIGLGVLFAWRRSLGGARPSAAAGKVLAVLPFENKGTAQDAYFADGVTDAVRGKLAALPGIQVIARASSAPYRKAGKTPEQIARELGAQYLLTGTVRWERGANADAGRVLVSPELVEVAAGGAPKTRWEQPFSANLTDVFQVQADIAERVAQALDVALGTGERQQIAERPTGDLAAYDAYLRGEEAAAGLDLSELGALRRARDYYERAIALDSTFALAWAQLSRAHSLIYLWNPSAADAEAARRAAERALAVVPYRSEGYLALGEYYSRVRKQDVHALGQYARGLQVAPRDPVLLTDVAFSELSIGRAQDALLHVRQAEALDPRSVATANFTVYVLLWLRRQREALAASERALALAPDNLSVLHRAVRVHLARGDLAGARAVLRAAPRQVDRTVLVAYMATNNDLYWVLDEAQQRLLLRLSPEPFGANRADWGMALAQTYALRGDSTMARAYADSARLAYEAQVRDVPENGTAHGLLGVMLGYLGRPGDAIREGERGLYLATRDGRVGEYNRHLLTRIYILAGEYEKALDHLEQLRRMPYQLSAGWLRIDPTFDPLRGNPRFERLVNGS
jgi:DNA-binding SARP family transcriptional activator/TolB-like protein